MFYEFRQNNSGGSFSGPAISVIVEADSASEANDIAESKGVYFNGCDDGSDCECCGDRWYSVDERCAMKVPSIYDTPLNEGHERSKWADHDEVPTAKVFYKNGSEEVFK